MRRLWPRLLVILAILGSAHLYLWWRLVAPMPPPWRLIATIVVIAFAPTLPIGILVGRRLTRARARPVLLTIYLWFGLATYLLLGAIASHVAVGFGADHRSAAELAAAAALVTVIAGLLHVARGPRVKRVTVPIANLPVETYTIVQLTDVHIGPLLGRRFAERVVDAALQLAPDLIVLTGDLVDGHVSELQAEVAPFGRLRAKDGVFAVTGNHEYYWDHRTWIDHLGSLGIHVLRNQHVTIAGTLELAGVDDFRDDVAAAVAGRDPALPLVLLAHHPRTVIRAAAHGVDLQLSGHTHGGQLLPWGWLARIWDPTVAGLARFGATWLYVSEGTGFWGPPLRVGTTQEITAITLRGTPRA